MPSFSLSLDLITPSSAPHPPSLSQSSNWDGNYGYKQLTNTTSVNAPIVGSRSIAMPGYPQFTTADGSYPVAPARPIPPTFFPGLYSTFTSPIQSAIQRAMGRKRKL